MLTKLLDKDPVQRITISDIREHSWFLSTDREIPSTDKNCIGELDITEEDIKEAVQEFQTPIHILVCEMKSLHLSNVVIHVKYINYINYNLFLVHYRCVYS